MFASEFIVVVERLGLNWKKHEENGHVGFLIQGKHLDEFYPLLERITTTPTIAHLDYESAHYHLSFFRHEDERFLKNNEENITSLSRDYDTLPERKAENVGK